MPRAAQQTLSWLINWLGHSSFPLMFLYIIRTFQNIEDFKISRLVWKFHDREDFTKRWRSIRGGLLPTGLPCLVIKQLYVFDHCYLSILQDDGKSTKLRTKGLQIAEVLRPAINWGGNKIPPWSLLHTLFYHVRWFMVMYLV